VRHPVERPTGEGLDEIVLSSRGALRVRARRMPAGPSLLGGPVSIGRVHHQLDGKLAIEQRDADEVDFVPHVSASILGERVPRLARAMQGGW
jgi:hypothetical protein